MWKGTLHIHIKYCPSVWSCKRKYKVSRIHLGDKRKGFRVINTLHLWKNLHNKMFFIPINRTIYNILGTVHPLAPNQFSSFWKRRKIPSVVHHQRKVLIIHRPIPIWVSYHLWETLWIIWNDMTQFSNTRCMSTSVVRIWRISYHRSNYINSIMSPLGHSWNIRGRRRRWIIIKIFLKG